MKKPVKVYNNSKNVVEAARERIALLFDLFQHIDVSVSGGKDSTVLAHLVTSEAKKRGRKVTMFFLDEETIYKDTIYQVDYLMKRLAPEVVEPAWLQVEFYHINNISLTGTRFTAWEKGKYNEWIWDKHEYSIKRHPWNRSTEHVKNKDTGLDFYDAILNFESRNSNAASIVGVRAGESMRRLYTVIKNPVEYAGHTIHWGSPRGKNFVFYPLYDWTPTDIWKYIYDHQLRYHKLYDWQFKKGQHIHNMRVGSLVDARSFRALADIPEFEPDTFNKLVKRVEGVLFAQETAKNSKVFGVRKLPKNYKSWIDYRDFLLATHPIEADRQMFINRFAKHLNNEFVARQQVRQLIFNDLDNDLEVVNKPDPRMELLQYYKEVL